MKTDLFHIGKFVIHGYGLMIGIGFVLALLVGEYRAKKMGMKEEALIDIAIIAGVSGFLGAKLLYIIVSFKDFIEDPIGVLGSSGFVVYGGLIAGVLCNLIYVKIKKLSFLEYFDLVMPEIALAQGFGRIGCFFAGCCYGIPYDPPIGICLKNAIGTAPTDIPLFPVQLLESGLNLLLAGLLQLCFRKRIRKTDVIPFYCIGYAGIRLFTERFRYDTERGIYFGLATSEWISLALAICGVLLLLVPSLRRKRASHS